MQGRREPICKESAPCAFNAAMPYTALSTQRVLDILRATPMSARQLQNETQYVLNTVRKALGRLLEAGAIESVYAPPVPHRRGAPYKVFRVVASPTVAQ